MTIIQQMVLTMFSEHTLTTVKMMFQTNDKVKPIEGYDISFRLVMINDNSINFEFGYNTPLGIYYKPIGYFNRNMQSYLINEFENTFTYLSINELLEIDILPMALSLRENAVIAAFSIDTLLEVLKTFQEISVKGYKAEFIDGIMIPPNLRYDKKTIINGLKSELIMTYEGYPQFFVDDNYNINGAIGAYRLMNGKIKIDPIVDFSADHDKLYARSLLSAFKSLKAEMAKIA